jgi:hypothetical protein
MRDLTEMHRNENQNNLKSSRSSSNSSISARATAFAQASEAPATTSNVNSAISNSNKKNGDEDDDDDNSSEYAFKWCFFTSTYLTRTAATWKFVFVVLCVCNFVENMVTSGVATVILSTIEKEFFLTSVEGGVFLAAYEIGAFVASPLCGYMGNRYNKMRLLGLSMIVVAAGAYVTGLTAFLKKADFELELFDPNATTASYSSLSSLCFLNSTQSQCSRPSSTPNLQYLLYAGHFLIGFASVAMYTVGIAYVEEITLENESAYCQAILYGCGK